MTDKIINDLASFYAGGAPKAVAPAPAPIPVAPEPIRAGSWQDYEARGLPYDAWPAGAQDQFMADQDSGQFAPPALPQTDVAALKAAALADAGAVVAAAPVAARSEGSQVDYVGTINSLVKLVFNNNVEAGWWTDLTTNTRLQRNKGELIALMHSELSECLEGVRKNLQDDHLPQYSMEATELADTVIRICDYAGAFDIPLGDAIMDKLAYNKTRLDHKIENRAKAGGKKF